MKRKDKNCDNMINKRCNMYPYNQKKEFIKNGVFITFILLIAIFSTHYIYYKFETDRNIDFNSESLDVTYHEKTGDLLAITKVAPLTDSVGLTSKTYTVSIKNNLTEKVNYKVQIIDDKEKIIEDDCGEYQIPKDDIKISVKVNNKSNRIYLLEDLENGILLEDKINALEKLDVSIRLWVKQDSTLPLGAKLHYHGKIRIIEEEKSYAIKVGEK